MAEGLVLVVRAGWAREPERRSLLIPPRVPQVTFRLFGDPILLMKDPRGEPLAERPQASKWSRIRMPSTRRRPS